jgi:hypothetical protein
MEKSGLEPGLAVQGSHIKPRRVVRRRVTGCVLAVFDAIAPAGEWVFSLAVIALARRAAKATDIRRFWLCGDPRYNRFL